MVSIVAPTLTLVRGAAADTIRDDMPAHGARITRAERSRSNRGRWGDIGMATLLDVLNRGAEGDVADLADLCEWVLDTDDLVYSLYDTRIMRVVQADWVIKPNPYGDAMLAASAADFVRNQFGRIESIVTVMRDLMHALATGFSALEHEWARDANGVSYIKRMHFRHPHRFRYDEQWQLRLYDFGMRRSESSLYGEALDPRLWTVHEYRTKAGYPGVGGVMRSCLIRWMFRRWADKWRIENLERFGSPFVLAEVPPNTPESTRSDILDQLDSMVSGHVAVVEQEGSIKIVSDAQSAKSWEAYQNYMEYTDRALSRAWLGTSDLTDPGLHGARAATETRVGATTDPRMVWDGLSLANSLQQCTFKQIILANPQMWDVPTDTVPVPIIQLKSISETSADPRPTVNGVQPQ